MNAPTRHPEIEADRQAWRRALAGFVSGGYHSDPCDLDPVLEIGTPVA